MRKALITHLREEKFYAFVVFIFVDDKLIGTGAYFRKLSQVRQFMNDCKVESYSIDYKEGNEWKEIIELFIK